MHIFYEIAAGNEYSCFLREDTNLPMMFLPDCIRGTVEFLETPRESLKQYTYNMTAVSFTPKQLADAIRPHFPKMKVTYDPDHIKQSIGNTICPKQGWVSPIAFCGFPHIERNTHLKL